MRLPTPIVPFSGFSNKHFCHFRDPPTQRDEENVEQIPLFSFSSIRGDNEYSLVRQKNHGDPEGMPTLVVVGSVGEGKSSLCNVLAGKEYNDHLFSTDGTTTTASTKTIQWRNNGQNICLVDTPGLFALGENENAAENSIVNELKNHTNVTVFAIVLNGSKPRFDQSRKQMIRKLQTMFGKKFLEKNTVFVITHWHYDEDSRSRRKNTGQDEISWKRDVNMILKDQFGLRNPKGVPVIFLDALYGDENNEKTKFQKGVDELESCLKTFPSYQCSSLKS